MANSRLEFLENKYYHMGNIWYWNESIFLDQQDYEKIYQVFLRFSHIYSQSFKIISYNFVWNSFQIVIQVKKTGRDVSDYMRKIQVSYAMYFKHKYKESTRSTIWKPVFQWRFFSAEISKRTDLEQLLSFVNLFPEKQNETNNIATYSYSSYHQAGFQDIIEKYRSITPTFPYYIKNFCWEVEKN